MLQLQAKIAERDFEVDLEIESFADSPASTATAAGATATADSPSSETNPAGLATGHIVIMGPNGSGKSTIIELLAGTIVPDSGLIQVGERVLVDLDARGAGTVVPPHERSTGLLAQDPLLFPHLNVLENVGFAPRNAGNTKAESAAVANEYLELVGCSELAYRKPQELSGGQAQRIAIARALAANPELILLDEPMSALDFEAVPQVLALLKQILKKRLSIMVTHDLMDAATLADYIVIMDRGRIAEAGPIDQVLADPQSPFGERLAGFAHLRKSIQQDDLDS